MTVFIYNADTSFLADYAIEQRHLVAFRRLTNVKNRLTVQSVSPA